MERESSGIPAASGSRARARRQLTALMPVLFVLALLVTLCGCKSGYPFDVVTMATDDNGFPLNPRWNQQVQDPNGPLPDVTLCAPSGGDDDNPQDWASAPHPCTHLPLTTDSALVCGPHVNFMPVAYEGKALWGGHSSFTTDNFQADDDYNIHLTRSDSALYNTGNPNYMHAEFDSDETIDHFQTPWWTDFRSSVDDLDALGASSVRGQYVLAVGLLGLDCAHDGCGVELHPVYMFAIRANENYDGSANASDDRWAFFARNRGDEGYCSSKKQSLPALSQYAIILPAPPKASDYKFLKKDVRFFNKDNSQVIADGDDRFQPEFAAGRGLRLKFRLPDPAQQGDDDYVIEGDIEVAWTVPPPPPKITVVKLLQPSSDAGLFDLRIDGATVASGIAAGSSRTQIVTVGAHKISEAASPGTRIDQYTTSIGGDCSPDGSVSVAVGEDKTCVITNTRKDSGSPSACAAQCKQTEDDCLQDVGMPRGPTAEECAAGFKNCLKATCK